MENPSLIDLIGSIYTTSFEDFLADAIDFEEVESFKKSIEE